MFLSPGSFFNFLNDVESRSIERSTDWKFGFFWAAADISIDWLFSARTSDRSVVTHKNNAGYTADIHFFFFSKCRFTHFVCLVCSFRDVRWASVRFWTCRRKAKLYPSNHFAHLRPRNISIGHFLSLQKTRSAFFYCVINTMEYSVTGKTPFSAKRVGWVMWRFVRAVL